MNTKLTLRLDDSLVESAKKYSVKTGKSVSKIMADLFSIRGYPFHWPWRPLSTICLYGIGEIHTACSKSL